MDEIAFGHLIIFMSYNINVERDASVVGLFEIEQSCQALDSQKNFDFSSAHARQTQS